MADEQVAKVLFANINRMNGPLIGENSFFIQKSLILFFSAKFNDIWRFNGVWLLEKNDPIQTSVNPNNPSHNQVIKLYIVRNVIQLYRTKKKIHEIMAFFQKMPWKMCLVF